jgi:hypothetical protein
MIDREEAGDRGQDRKEEEMNKDMWKRKGKQ